MTTGGGWGLARTATVPARPAAARTTLVIAALAALATWPACDSRPLPVPGGLPYSESVLLFEQDAANDLDVLFVIDNSRSMQREQGNLIRNFPAFMESLKRLPGGLPNLHVGVVSTDLGAGRSPVGGCAPGGDGGALQNKARGMGGRCTGAPTDRYIVSLDGGTRNNFTGDIAASFACIAELGTTGCGIEHPLQAARVALGGGPGGLPAPNAGFLRKNAALAVIYITDEDDCSVPPDSTLFHAGGNNTTCALLGHLCHGQPPDLTPGALNTDCHSNEDGPLIPVREQVAFLKRLKRNPNRVLVAAIAGPVDPYRALANELAPSCMTTDSDAVPAPRMKDFADAFGDGGVFVPICDDDLSIALDGIATRLGAHLYSQCIECPLLDRDATTPGLQFECDVADSTDTPGGPVTTPLPRCDGGPARPCWHLVPDDQDCAVSGFKVTVERDDRGPPADTFSVARCVTCPSADDPRCRR